MREILFRAKDYKGNWLYGSLVKKTFLQPNWNNLSQPKDITNYLIVSKPEFSWTDEYDTTEVIENTIGQYTGFQDKNGKKIFEGDIVLVSQIAPAKVFYNEEDACYAFNYGKNGKPLAIDLIDDTSLEVIGNIYDNPELLEVEE